MKKIFLALVLTGLSGFVLLGCGGEPRSVEELQKLSKTELEELFTTCQKDGNAGKFDKDKKKANENETELQEKYGILGWNAIAEIQNTSNYTKEFIECGRIYKALYE